MIYLLISATSGSNNCNDYNDYNDFNDYTVCNDYNDYSDYNDNNNYNDYRDSVSDLDLDRERFSDKVTIVTQLTDKLRNLNHALRGSDL